MINDDLDETIRDILGDDDPAESIETPDAPPPEGLKDPHLRTWRVIRALEQAGVEDINSGVVRRRLTEDVTSNAINLRMRRLVELGALERDPDGGDPRGYRWFTSPRGERIILERAAWWLDLAGEDDLAEQVRDRLGGDRL
jgi:DNA-binding HxlR family transcriptional regulator